MQNVTVASKFRTASHLNVPAADTKSVKVVIKLLYYLERPVNTWTGPLKVFAGHERIALINDKNMLKASVDRLEE